jgi:hypothetical protein
MDKMLVLICKVLAVTIMFFGGVIFIGKGREDVGSTWMVGGILLLALTEF